MKLVFLLFFWGVASARTATSEPNPTQAPEETTTEKSDASGVVDFKRPCPPGFFYAGEPSYDKLKDEHTRGMWAEKGPTSPVYSCYRVEKDQMDWPTANRRCWKREAQLISVNNFKEDEILQSEKFTEMLRKNEVELPNNVLSSGVNFGDGYFWFATGEELTDNQTVDLSEDPSCVVLSWEESSLTYRSLPCVNTANSTAVCEVRVYVQTWYVWFFDNWLQLLFLFTLVLLIISACLTLQVWTSRPSRRPATSSNTPTATANHNATSGFNNNKYVHKGKELLAKVVFYSPSKPEDKEKLATATQA